MAWLNYHHLYYFWVTAREGSIQRACKQLLLAQPTISGQIRALEVALGKNRGSQSGAASAQQRLRAFGIRCSMSRPGHGCDNAGGVSG